MRDIISRCIILNDTQLSAERNVSLACCVIAFDTANTHCYPGGSIHPPVEKVCPIGNGRMRIGQILFVCNFVCNSHHFKLNLHSPVERISHWGSGLPDRPLVITLIIM